MLMDSFEVENFRSLKHLKLEKLARVNLLVGKNNSGKTSALEAMYTLTRIEEPEWFETLESMRGIYLEEQDFRSLFNNFNLNSSIQIKASYNGAGKSPGRYRFMFSSLNESIAKRKRKSNSTFLIKIWIGTRKSAYEFEMHRDKDGITSYESISNNADELSYSGLPDKLASRHISNFLTTSIDFEELSNEISILILNKDEGRLIHIMKQIDSRIESLSLDTKGRIYFDLGNQYNMLSSINLMGEGIQRLLTIVTAIAAIAGGIIFIDEIDNGLHYSALRILWKGILQAAREYDVQVFATTHSAEALRHLTWVLDEEENAQYRDDIATYTLIRAEDDTVRSYRYGYSQLEFALERGVEVRN